MLNTQPARPARPLTAALLGLALAAPMLVQAQGMSIGAILPESWPSATQAEDMRDGMTLALKTTSLQPAPRLVLKDSGCDARKAQAAAQSFVTAKVDLVIGGFCVLGEVPSTLKAANVPMVSANAERLKSHDGLLQLGRVGAGVAEDIASKLRSQTGLRVTASSACWIDFETPVSEKYDAGLCPALSVDKTRWNEVAAAFEAAFRKPFSVSAARGHAAMEVALAYLKRQRNASRAAAASEALSQRTVLGQPLAKDGIVPEDALQLSFASRQVKAGSRDAQVMDQLVKAKSCECKAGPDCGKGSPWAGMPFTVVPPGSKPAACPQVLASR